MSDPFANNPFNSSPPDPFAKNPFAEEEDGPLSGAVSLFSDLLNVGFGENSPFMRGTAGWRKIIGENQAAQAAGNTLLTVAQPLQAPQQALFAGVSAIGGAVDELKGEEGAFGAGLEQAGRGLEGALGYASFGKLGDQKKALLGRDLFKQVGAPTWVQKWGGLAADIFGDPTTLIGGAGVALKGAGAAAKGARAASLGAKLASAGEAVVNASRVVERVGNAYRVPENALVAADRVRKAFGVQSDVTSTVGRELRNLTGQILDNPRSSGYTPAELFIPNALQERVLPEATAERIRAMRQIQQRSDAVKGQFDMKLAEVYKAYQTASRGLKKPQVDELDRLAYRVQSSTTNAAQQKAIRELEEAAQRFGDPGIADRWMAANQKGAELDALGGSMLQSVGYAARGTQSGQDMAASVRRSFLLFGAQGDAFVQKIYAMPRKAGVANMQMLTRRLQSAQADPRMAQGIEDALAKNPDASLRDALIEARNTLQLDPIETQRVFDAIMERPRGFGLEMSNLDAGDRLSRLRDGAKGAAKFGKEGVGEALTTQRQVLDDELLREYGEIESVLAQYERQGDGVAQLTTAKQALIETRALIAQETGGRIFKASDVDLPAEILRSKRSGDGVWREVTPELKDKLGVFESGDMVPAWYHRSLQAQNLLRADGAAGEAITTIMRANNIWKTVKLSNRPRKWLVG
jgi:hypothetical protein